MDQRRHLRRGPRRTRGRRLRTRAAGPGGLLRRAPLRVRAGFGPPRPRAPPAHARDRVRRSQRRRTRPRPGAGGVPGPRGHRGARAAPRRRPGGLRGRPGPPCPARGLHRPQGRRARSARTGDGRDRLGRRGRREPPGHRRVRDLPRGIRAGRRPRARGTAPPRGGLPRRPPAAGPRGQDGAARRRRPRHRLDHARRRGGRPRLRPRAGRGRRPGRPGVGAPRAGPARGRPDLPPEPGAVHGRRPVVPGLRPDHGRGGRRPPRRRSISAASASGTAGASPRRAWPRSRASPPPRTGGPRSGPP